MANRLQSTISDLQCSSELNQSLPPEGSENACYAPPVSTQLCTNLDQYQSPEPNSLLACFPQTIGSTKLFRSSPPLLFQSSITGALGIDPNQLIFTIPAVGSLLLLSARMGGGKNSYTVTEAIPEGGIHQGMIQFEIQADDHGRITEITPSKITGGELSVKQDPQNPETFIFTVQRGRPAKSITFSQRLKVIHPPQNPVSGKPTASYVAFDQTAETPAVTVQQGSSFLSFSTPRLIEDISIVQEMELTLAHPIEGEPEIGCRMVLLSDHSIAVIYFGKSSMLPGSALYRYNGANPPRALQLIQEGKVWSVIGDYPYSFGFKRSWPMTLQIVERSVVSPTTKLADEIRNIDVELQGESLSDLDRLVLRYRRVIVSHLQSPGKQETFSTTLLSSLQRREGDDLRSWFKRAKHHLVSIGRISGLGAVYNQNINPFVEYMDVHLTRNLPIELARFPSTPQEASRVSANVARQVDQREITVTAPEHRPSDRPATHIPGRPAVAHPVATAIPILPALAVSPESAEESVAACLPEPKRPIWNGEKVPEGFLTPTISHPPSPLQVIGWSKSSTEDVRIKSGNVQVQYLGVDSSQKNHFLLYIMRESEINPTYLYLVAERNGTLWQDATGFVLGEKTESDTIRSQGRNKIVISGQRLALELEPQVLTLAARPDEKRTKKEIANLHISLSWAELTNAGGQSVAVAAPLCLSATAEDLSTPILSQPERAIATPIQSQMLRTTVYRGENFFNSESLQISVNLYYLWSEGNLRHYSLRFDNGIEAYLVIERDNGNNLKIVQAYIGEQKATFERVGAGKSSTWKITDSSMSITLDTGVLTKVLSRDRNLSDFRFFLLNETAPVCREPEALQSLPEEPEAASIRNNRFKEDLRKEIGVVRVERPSSKELKQIIRNLESLAAGSTDHIFYQEYLSLKMAGFEDLVLYGFAQNYVSLYVPKTVYPKELILRDLVERSLHGAVADAGFRGAQRDQASNKVKDYLEEKRREAIEREERKERDKI